MDAVADIAAKWAFSEIRVSHEQNLILPYVALDDLTAVYDRLASVGLATPNAGLISDIIACPGLDYCALATARSIPIAQRISQRFGAASREKDIGPLKIKISGCINACGHHHAGHIGILGVDKNGVELYQISLGGDVDFGHTTLGEIIHEHAGGMCDGLCDDARPPWRSHDRPGDPDRRHARVARAAGSGRPGSRSHPRRRPDRRRVR